MATFTRSMKQSKLASTKTTHLHQSMPSSPQVMALPILLFLLCQYGTVSAVHYPAVAGGGASCTRLFTLGDSFNDVGNFESLSPNTSFLTLPYGETFFGQPSGRFCDGRLIVDFVAEALRLPAFSLPYLLGKTARDFRRGVNFAVTGATALNQSFFRDMGLNLGIIPPYSLDVQLDLFKNVLYLLGPNELERKDIMSSSLFLMGEIGINDYNHPLFQNRPFATEIKPLLPKVIAKIENAIKVLMSLGAEKIVVPGIIAMGCFPRYLIMFRSNSSAGDYDAAGCLKWLNDFSEEHNRALKSMLHRIVPHDDPTVTVIYADYYGAMLEIIRNPLKYGFTEDGALKACCGDGRLTINCNATSILCPDPARYISWDGLHLTEAAYRFVAHGVLHGPYAEPSILSKC